MIIYRESPFSNVEYLDVLSLWPEGARRLSSVDSTRDVLALGVIMAKHAMERSKPPHEIESQFRQIIQSNWYQTIWKASLKGRDISATAAARIFEEEARGLPQLFSYRKRGNGRSAIHYTDPEEGRKAVLEVEFGKISPSASFGVVHPDSDYFFTLQSFFGIPGQWSCHFTSLETGYRQVRNMLSFVVIFLPMFARTRIDLTLPSY